MTKLEHVCQGSGKTNDIGRPINEDKLIYFSVPYEDDSIDFTILMDGATGLGRNYQIIPGYTSAEWYVDFMAINFYQTFKKDPMQDIKKVIEKCIDKAIKVISKYEEESGIKLEEYEKPSSALLFQRVCLDNIELFLLGDADTIVEYSNGTIEQVHNPNQINLQNNDSQVINKMKEISKNRHIDVIDTRNTDEIKKMLEINRTKKNKVCDGGYWVLGTSNNIIEHGVHLNIKKEQVKSILLTSDGFNRDIIGKDEKEILDLINLVGVGDTLKLIRKAENDDKKCNKYPRFKAHDDATAAYTTF